METELVKAYKNTENSIIRVAYWIYNIYSDNS